MFPTSLVIATVTAMIFLGIVVMNNSLTRPINVKDKRRKEAKRLSKQRDEAP